MHDSAQKLANTPNYTPVLEDISLKQIPTRISNDCIDLIRKKAAVDDRTLRSTVERAIRLYCLGNPVVPDIPETP